MYLTVAELTLTALRECNTEPLPGYAQSLRSACETAPPPFGAKWYGDSYRALALNPHWLIQSLVSNAAKEGEGARQLWQLAGQIGEHDLAEAVRQHAVDESRHARYYISMLQLAFPEAADEELLLVLHELSPGYTSTQRPPSDPPRDHHDVMDELIQTNIGEIRTRIHQLLMRPVIYAYCPPRNKGQLQRLLDAILADETKHIQYTARIINRAFADDEGFVEQTMRRRLEQFNEITLVEVGKQVFNGT